jgi:peptidoglycan/LPS O-acetylase OafA/YrhL
LGRISYGIYVYHFLLIPFLPGWLSRIGLPIRAVNQSWGSFWLCTGAAILVASVSWRLLEEPFLRLKRSAEPASPPAR